MNTKKKRKWLHALSETIALYYKLYYRTITPVQWTSSICPLCTIVDTHCINCIHKTTFSQNKKCTFQTSFLNIRYTSLQYPNSIINKQHIGYRIHVLKQIKKRIRQTM